MVRAKLTFEILSRNSNRITQRRLFGLAGRLRRHRRPPATGDREPATGRPPGATGHRPPAPAACRRRPGTLRPAAPGRASACRPLGHGRKANGPAARKGERAEGKRRALKRRRRAMF